MTYDFKIDHETAELDFTGDAMHFTQDRLEYLRLKIRCEINLTLHEYWFAYEKGVPYIPEFDWGKQQHIDMIVNTVHIRILEVEHITKLTHFDYELDKSARHLTITFIALTDENEELDDSVLIAL